MLRVPFALIWNLIKLLPFAIKAFFFRLGHFLTRKQRKWVRLKLPSRQPFGPASGMAKYFQDKRSYLELRDDVQRLADDPHIEGVVVTADNLATGAARASDLRALLKRLRKAEKSIVFHTHSVMGREYDLALEADDVLLTPGGRFYLFGLSFDQYFASPLLERLGVAAQFVHIGPYKGAAHRFIHDQATPPLRLMMNQLLDSLATMKEKEIVETRGMTEESLQSTFGRMPLDDRHALAGRLVDARIHRRMVPRWISDRDDFIDTPPESADPANKTDKTDKREEKKRLVHISDSKSYADAQPDYVWTPLLRRSPLIATMDLSGMIVMAGMELPGHSAATIDPDEVLPVLHKLATNRRVAAVVLHINSPGGNALASELIWDGIRRLRCEKPTIAYCSDVAASGGYYMAVAADRIVCQPNTITGSIGVIAGKMSFPGALDKMGIKAESFRRHETALFQSLAEPLSEQVLDNLRRDARSFYRQFLRRVGEARHLPRRRLHRYARGRVYTGVDAHHRHLVDHLGGFDDALELARKLAGLPEDALVRFQPHRKVSLPSLLKKSATSALLPQHLRELHVLNAMIRHDPVLALMPLRPVTPEN